MTLGKHTSEFWLSAFWSVKAAAALAALLTVGCSCWHVALIAMPPVCLLIYFAAAIANNYGENRFLLKHSGQDDSAKEELKEPRAFGFRGFAQSNEESGDDDDE